MSVNMLTVALLSTGQVSQIGGIQTSRRKANNEDNIVRIRLQAARMETDIPVPDDNLVNATEISECPKVPKNIYNPKQDTHISAAESTSNPAQEEIVTDAHNYSPETETLDEAMNIGPKTPVPLLNEDETTRNVYRQSCDTKGQAIPQAISAPLGAVVTLSPAEELKMKILTIVSDGDIEPIDELVKPQTPSQEPWETVLEYFSRIYGFPGPSDFNEGNIKLFPEVNISEEEFVGPFHSPGYLGISASQMADGITVTVSAVETINTFYMYDHTSSSQLMALETEMNRWYGYYLWRKVTERMGFVFEIVPGGYYAVYLENLKIWARCFIDEVLPSSRNLFYHPEQRIRAVLFDYEGRLRTFERKQFLPLTRAFISIPVQKTIGKIECSQENLDFPWNTGDISVIRQKLEGGQFRAFVSEYDILTEPFAVMTVRLCEAIDMKVDKKQWRKLCEQHAKTKL